MSGPRTLARRSAVQALYQWQLTGLDLDEIERQFHEEHGLGSAEVSLFHELLHGVPEHLEAIDQAVGAYADRAVNDIDPVERAILRLGSYELLLRPDVPYRVVLNEAINLAKDFGAAHSHKYVNGILDKVARQYRPHELPSRKN